MDKNVVTTKGVEPVGFFRDGVYRKTVRREHLYRKLNAWCVAVSIIDQMAPDDVVELTSSDGIYTATARTISRGAVIHYPPHEKQYALPEGSWKWRDGRSLDD